jgi:hypothetical protein
MAKVIVSKNKLWKAIRKQCLDCVCGSEQEVKLCTDPECSLYPYRFGRPLKDNDPVNQKQSKAFSSPSIPPTIGV